MPNLNERLGRFGSLVTSGSASVAGSSSASRYQKLASAVSGKLIKTHCGTFVEIRTLYPRDYLHGNCLLENTLTPVQYSLSAFTLVDSEGSVAQRDLMYIDTETTGLGGTGAVPFLIGFGQLNEAGFEIRQFLMPDYSDEAGMLESLMEQIGPESAFVTYNGAAFDLPLLRDRVIINRIAREFAGNRSHIDLLHPTRRLFKRRIKDCSLVNAERHLLGFTREADTPGYLIPSIYFDWLSNENATPLPGVLEHNRFDILSLHFLLTHIHRVFQSEGEALDRGEDLYSLSRVYHRRKHHDKAAKTCDRIPDFQPDLPDEMRLFHALTLKKVGEWERAVFHWEYLAQGVSRESYWANVELAKYYEHHERDFGRAIKSAQNAIHQCTYSETEKARLEKRLARLSEKARTSNEPQP